MSISPASAAAVYAAVAKTNQGAAAAPAGEAAAGTGSAFADMLKGVVDQFDKTGGAAETHAVAGATEDAELVDVVTSIAAAELSLETVIAVRDKVIAAYQDIMKMPI